MSHTPTMAVARARQALRAALLIPAIVIGALCALLAWQVGALADHNHWVTHTHEVIAQTWRVEKLLVDRETGLRARLLSGDDAFLEPYRAAGTELPPALDTLAGLTADNPVAQSRIRDLRVHQERWLREAEAALAKSRETQVIVPAGFREEMMVRKAEMDGMRATIGSILADEERLLEERRQASRSATRHLVLAGGGAALLLGLGASLALQRLVRSLDATYAEAFRAQSEALRVAEALAGEVTEQLEMAMGTISDARAAQQKAEARVAELERKA